MFRLVKNTATAFSWLMTPGHSWFDKHELRYIKHLMDDLGHSHIYTMMLASAGQILIFPLQFIGILIKSILINLVHLNMCNLLVHVF
jgi:hypothetical protein